NKDKEGFSVTKVIKSEEEGESQTQVDGLSDNSSEETFEQAFAKAREEGKEKFKFSGKDNKGRVKEGVFTTEIAEDTVDLKTKTDNNKNVETTTETSGESLSVNDREN